MKQYFSVLLPFMAACVFAVSCSSGSEGYGTSNPKNPLEEDITEVQTPAPLAAEPYSPSKLGLSYKPIMVKYSSLKPSVNWNTANESKTRIMNNMVGFTPETDYQKYKNSVNKYGGSTVLPRQTATGRFYTKKINGRWWIVDPEGCLNVHRGLASFRTSETTAGKAALATKYGSEDTWISYTIRQLQTLGIHSTGAFSTPYTHMINYNKANPGVPITYAPSFGFVSGARKKGNYSYPDGNSDYSIGLILYSGFAENVKKYAAEALAPYKNDANLLGVYSDNELNFSSMSTYVLRTMLSIQDTNNEARQAAVKFMEDKNLQPTVAAFNAASNKESLNDEFAGQIAEIYYKACREAIKAVDPQMLYLGSRLNGTPKYMEGVYRAAGRYCDIISINYYSRWSVELTTYVDSWETWADTPFMVTEFYACGADTPLDNDSRAGWLVRTQEDRAFFYQHFTLGLLESKHCVGWDWFRYMDSSTESDGDSRNNGLYSDSYELYPELAQYMRDLNTNVYGIITYFDK